MPRTILAGLIILIAALGDAAAATVHVVSNGWHTGLIVARADIPDDRIPELADLGDVAYVEFGWGDRDYYPNPRPTWDMALAAALTPSPSVIHVAGLTLPPERARPGSELIALTVSADGLDALIDGLDATFDRPADGPVQSVARGLYADSRFYPAVGSFHLFNTCNTWIARLLAGAGVDIAPEGVITAEDLMSRLRDAPPPAPAPRPPAER